ncbi:hypothetical protein [Candidatus Uabimicrobium amorphum]|uniref:Uncharacterized protein n=1 Tax=Uabimicrobium amorphum TaxID=2596890 RepID=A0A5S9F6M3_UABAM|nr:hypothetical protein [Candidatus Uabimicrobium amorphum]BBM88026.1 hypothetical protein UABAM_06442 [Candidatus Uabimicrobium amorphum]
MKDDIEDLVKKIIEEEDGGIREELREVLVGFGQPAIHAILPFLGSDDWQIRYRLVSTIGQIGIESKQGFLGVEEAINIENDEEVKRVMMQTLLGAKVPIVTEFSESMNEKSAKLKKIWKFSGEEAEKIKELFAEQKIVFREHVLCCGHPDYPSYAEIVTFEVLEKQFAAAVEVVKDFFGLGSGSGFTGECPACGTHVENATTCPECGLNLEMDPNEIIQYHPFGEFLENIGE